MVRGAAALPHGTGRSVRVCVFAKDDAAQQARDAGASMGWDHALVAFCGRGDHTSWRGGCQGQCHAAGLKCVFGQQAVCMNDWNDSLPSSADVKHWCAASLIQQALKWWGKRT